MHKFGGPVNLVQPLSSISGYLSKRKKEKSKKYMLVKINLWHECAGVTFRLSSSRPSQLVDDLIVVKKAEVAVEKT